MFNPFYILLLMLVIWRLTNLFIYEEGPFDIFLRLRKAVGIVEDEEIPNKYFPKLLSCYLCFSAMASLIIWPIYVNYPEQTLVWAGWLAISSGVIFLYKLKGD